MNTRHLYLSPPAVYVPSRSVSNDEIIQMAREQYRGDPSRWPMIEEILRLVFRKCGTLTRQREEHPDRQGSAAMAALPARALLETHDLSPKAIDLVLYAGVTREYLEPAVAMEVASRVGMERVHGFDMTLACVGALEAIRTAAAHLLVAPGSHYALVATAEYAHPHLNLELERPEDLRTRSAAFTISDAASAWLVSDRPFAGGCGRIEAFRSVSLPQHWELCTARLGEGFVSHTQEMFNLRHHLTDQLGLLLDDSGWTLDEVDHFVLHQPSEALCEAVLGDLGAPREKHLSTHPLYANSVTSAIALNLHEVLRQRGISPGDKVVFAGAAGGISVAAMSLTWQEG